MLALYSYDTDSDDTCRWRLRCASLSELIGLVPRHRGHTPTPSSGTASTASPCTSTSPEEGLSTAENFLRVLRPA